MQSLAAIKQTETVQYREDEND